MKNTIAVLPDPLPETFDALNMIHQLRPIRDDIDYENAVAIVDQLAVLNKRTQDQDDYLETLGELISKYDYQYYTSQLDHLSPIQSLKYLLEQNEINLSQLSEILREPTSLVQQLLSGEQELSKTHIRILARHFKVKPDFFLAVRRSSL